jgi:hypothetical protein
MVEPPPLPVSEELAATEAVIVNVLLVGTVTTLYSIFKIAAVMLPPREAASLKVT